MSKALQDITQTALELGACDMIRDVRSESELLQVLFTPQGREFCKRNCFPSIRMIDQLQPHKTMLRLQDPCPHELHNPSRIAVVGKLSLPLSISYTKRNRLFRLILIHGAKVTLRIAPHCQVQITEVGRDNRYIIAERGEGALITEG